MSNIIQEILNDRFSFYDSALKNDSFYWDDYFKSWVVFDYESTEMFLNHPNFSANRKKGFLEKFNINSESKKFLSDFYSNWLMYLDGEKHEHLKNELQTILRKTLPACRAYFEEEIEKAFSCIQNSQSVDYSRKSEKIVTTIMSLLFGISEDNYSVLLKKSKACLEFLWFPSHNDRDALNTITSIEETKEFLTYLYSSNQVKEHGLLFQFLKQKNLDNSFLSLMINIIIDGHDPLVSSLKSQMFYSIENNKIMSSFDTLKIESPFPLTARIAIEDFKFNNFSIKKNDRVILFISSANRDKKIGNNTTKHLSFGSGVHFCPGSSIVYTVLSKVEKCINEFEILSSFTVNSFEWDDKFGFRTLNSLELKKKEKK